MFGKRIVTGKCVIILYMQTDGQFSSRFFDSLAYYPNVELDVQHESEKIILLIREHPITQVPWIINVVGLSFILVLLNILLPQLFNPAQIVFINFFSIVLIFSYAWINFLRWFFEIGVVTNERIIDIDFKSVLYKEVTIAKVENVQEISSRSSGYIGTLFNYGNVYVQTSGADIDIEFQNAPDPTYIVKMINKLTHEVNGNRI